MITYAYDGLLRLRAAVEQPGTAFTYADDLAGNRIAATQNGALVEQHTYDAANQVVGLTYDAVGNLLNDASTTSTYDALNRLVQQASTSNIYNGDGVLVQSGAIAYTQDLASPLTQILQTQQGGIITQHLYGLQRLASVTGATRTWYGADALLSVRLTLDDTGAVLGAANYDPWGTVEGSAVAPFGFTGELQDTAAGLVNLRARWYSTRQGRFGARDTFQGDPERPDSQHPYQYGYSDPVRMTDPSGQCAEEAFGNYQDPCMKAYHQAMEQLGWSESIHTDLFLAFDSTEFATLEKWAAAGIKLDTFSSWDSDSVRAVMYALERVEKAVGRQKARAILGLSGGRTPRGSLVFENNYHKAKSATDLGGGGYDRVSTHIVLDFLDYGTDTSFVEKNTPGGLFEGKVQTLIHELGHVVDAVAKPYAPAITYPDSPYWSSQLGGSWLDAAGWSKLCTNEESWEISMEGRAGGVSLYAVAGVEGVVNRDPWANGTPYEDFAETFAWYVMNKTSMPFYRNITPSYTRHLYLFENPLNGGSPSKERTDAIENLLSQF